MAVRTVRLNGGSISATDIDGVVNVKDYGAVGDGTTDDTTAVGAAYTAASGRPLFFPNGTYLVTALPALTDKDRLVGSGYSSIIKYAGSGTLLTLTSKQDVSFRSLDIWISAAGGKAFDLSGCFQISFDDVRIRGAHDGSTGSTYYGQKGLILRDNTGNTRIHNCVFENLGEGIETSCIQNEMTNSKIVNCYNSIKGIGGTANAGFIAIGCEFIGDTDPDTVAAHVNITGTANTWIFDGCWFEGSTTGLVVGVFGSGGPSSFLMSGCKVAARSVGIQFNNCRQPTLIGCEFNVDSGGTMTEIVFGGSPAGDEVIEGMAINLVTTLRSDFVDADFPQYWNIFRRGSMRTPNFHSTANAIVDGTTTTGDLKVVNGSPTAGKVLTSTGTDGSMSWATPDATQAELDAKQGLDATLTALAAVTTAADKVIYATGVDTFTTTDLTSTARTLLDDTSTSAMRTTLGLVIGTNVQAWDADLDTLAAKAIPTGALIGTTDAQTMSAKRINPRVTTVAAPTGTPSINSDNSDFAIFTGMTTAVTSMTTNLTGTPVDGQRLWISFTGTAARTIAWGASYEASTVALPTTTVTTARLDVGFVWNAATSKWRCVAVA
jgi:hypothetical protein